MFSDSLAHKRCCIYLLLTEVAGEGGPDLAPQIFLLSQYSLGTS